MFRKHHVTNEKQTMLCGLRSLLLGVSKVEASEASFKGRFVDSLTTKAATGDVL